MSEGLPNLNTTITLTQKSTGSDYIITGDVFNFKESGMTRKVEYKKVVGGRVITLLQNPESSDVSFEFVFAGSDLKDLVNEKDWTFDLTDIEANQYLVELNFANTTETYTKRYYDSYITDFNLIPKNEVIEGNIKFSLPSISLNGNATVFSGSDLTVADTYNTTMGY